MTFERFQETVKANRPDVRVHQHKTFGGIQDVAVTFVRNGKESKVYNYSGSYAAILRRLNINVISSEEASFIKNRIEILRRTHGRQSYFGGVVDNTAEIARLEESLKVPVV